MASLEERQMVHQNVLRHFVKTGRAPHYTEIAEGLGIVPEKARQIIRDTDYIASWAPFSSQPNQHLISVEGVQKWYGQ